MINSVLFVCLGNICRSPASETVLRSLAPDLEIDSAGTGGWHAGEAPYEPMQEAARSRGYDMSALRARKFRRADFDAFDLILVMDADNLADVEALRPVGNDLPVRLFTDYLLDDSLHVGATEIPDPWYTHDFTATIDLVEECARGLVKRIGG